MKATLSILTGATLILSATTECFSTQQQDYKSLCPAPQIVLAAQQKEGDVGQFWMEENNLSWHVHNSAVQATTLKEVDRHIHSGGTELTCTYTGTYNGQHTERDPVILRSSVKKSKIS